MCCPPDLSDPLERIATLGRRMTSTSGSDGEAGVGAIGAGGGVRSRTPMKRDNILDSLEYLLFKVSIHIADTSTIESIYIMYHLSYIRLKNASTLCKLLANKALQ